jgi:hypothetical protein
LADDLPARQRHARELAEIALGLVAVRSASGAASERATNEQGHAVTRWMITLARLDHSARSRGDPPVALPVATVFLGPEQPSKDAIHVDFPSVILFGHQVLDQFPAWWSSGWAGGTSYRSRRSSPSLRPTEPLNTAGPCRARASPYQPLSCRHNLRDAGESRLHLATNDL